MDASDKRMWPHKTWDLHMQIFRVWLSLASFAETCQAFWLGVVNVSKCLSNFLWWLRNRTCSRQSEGQVFCARTPQLGRLAWLETGGRRSISENLKLGAARLRLWDSQWCFWNLNASHAPYIGDIFRSWANRLPVSALNSFWMPGQSVASAALRDLQILWQHCVDACRFCSALSVPLLPFATAPCCLWLCPCHHVLRYT